MKSAVTDASGAVVTGIFNVPAALIIGLAVAALIVMIGGRSFACRVWKSCRRASCERFSSSSFRFSGVARFALPCGIR